MLEQNNQELVDQLSNGNALPVTGYSWTSSNTKNRIKGNPRVAVSD